jgi:hypothetical protein
MNKQAIVQFARAAFVAALALAGRAPAQFQGDVYFASPSVSVPQGGIAEMAIEAYVGATALGAAHVEVEFTAGSADVVGFDGPTDAALHDNVGQAVTPGRWSAVVFNAKSVDRPIGTVRLGVLRIRPLVDAGQQVRLQIRVRALLDGTTTAFPSTRGFVGVISVTSPSGGAPGASAPESGAREMSFAEFTPAWQRLLLRMGRPGSEVVVHVPVAVAGAVVTVPVRVQLPPAASSDR